MQGLEESANSARILLSRAQFHSSYPEPRQMPADVGVEVAFAGRSNAGKSTAINALCAQRSLARTSRTPGRTQHLVVFELDAQRRLIDLPGFGYAKVSKSVRAHWQRALPEYLEQRRSLNGLVLLMDCRHPLKELDEIVIAWCRDAAVPLHVLLSKADKLSRGAASAELHKVRRYLEKNGGEQATVSLFSALKHQGYDQAWTVLAPWFRL